MCVAAVPPPHDSHVFPPPARGAPSAAAAAATQLEDAQWCNVTRAMSSSFLSLSAALSMAGTLPVPVHDYHSLGHDKARRYEEKGAIGKGAFAEVTKGVRPIETHSLKASFVGMCAGAIDRTLVQCTTLAASVCVHSAPAAPHASLASCCRKTEVQGDWWPSRSCLPVSRRVWVPT